MSLPLSGLLVVSLEQAVAAPMCTCRLADAGARVIKVERPEGDFARYYDKLAVPHTQRGPATSASASAPASPPPFRAELGSTRVRPPHESAEVGNIRLRLEGQGGGRQYDRAFQVPPPHPSSRSRMFPTSATPLSGRTRVNPSSAARGGGSRPSLWFGLIPFRQVAKT